MKHVAIWHCVHGCIDIAAFIGFFVGLAVGVIIVIVMLIIIGVVYKKCFANRQNNAAPSFAPQKFQ